MHAGCMQAAWENMQAACRLLHACSLHTLCKRLWLQQHACSLHAGCKFNSRRIFLASTPCMQNPALRFKCSRLHWNTRAHSRRRRPASIALHPGSRRPAHRCRRPACRLHAGRRRQENTPRMNMLILGVFFRAYFSIFSLWQHVLML